MEEIWKDIDGYEGLYQISNLGNVKSLNYGKRGYAKNLTPKINDSNHLWVELRKNGTKKQMLIHRLVAFAFIPNLNPEKYTLINHKDENPANNKVDNLEWCDNRYNVCYSLERRGKLRKKTMRTRKNKGYTKRKDMRIVQISMDGEIMRIFPNIASVVKEFGYSNWSIAQCCKGERKQAYGYKWEFAN